MHLKALSLAWIAQLAYGRSFLPPFKQDDWKLSGDARITDKSVELVHQPKQKGAVWAAEPVLHRDFTLEAVIKSSPDSKTDVGKSGFAIWYTDKPSSTGEVHGSSDSWDGLAIMVDSLASGGSVRGHLNDGTEKFSSLKNIDTDSLSLCRIDYRMAASPITIRIGFSESEGFAVDVNGQKCFLSTEMSLPKGYYFGISADSDVSGDTLAVERLEITPGMKPELAAYLPNNDGNNFNLAGEQQARSDPAAGGSAGTGGSSSTSPASHSSHGDQGITPDEVKRLIDPVAGRVELMEEKLTQVQSSVEQLVETISISLGQLSDHGAKKGDASGSSVGSTELAAIQKELHSLRTQISDWHKSSGSSGSSGFSGSSDIGPVKSSPSTWLVILVVLPVQLIAVVLYHSWLRRKERHEKLL